MYCLCCIRLWIVWRVGLSGLPLQQDGISFLDVVGPYIGLVVLVHLLPRLFLPVLVSCLLYVLPFWVGPDVRKLGSELPGKKQLCWALACSRVWSCSVRFEVLLQL